MHTQDSPFLIVFQGMLDFWSCLIVALIGLVSRLGMPVVKVLACACGCSSGCGSNSVVV